VISPAKAPGASLVSKAVPTRLSTTAPKAVPAKEPVQAVATPPVPPNAVDKTIKAIDDGIKVIEKLGGFM
jgi:hypothetical protein